MRGICDACVDASRSGSISWGYEDPAVHSDASRNMRARGSADEPCDTTAALPQRSAPMSHSLIFFYTPMSSATRVHWALEELEVPYEKKKLDLTKGEQRTPEYLKLNPNGKIPLIVADGRPIFESLAQLLF